MINIQDIGIRAKAAARALAAASAGKKREALHVMAHEVMSAAQDIFEANARDLEAARANGMSEALQDRLRLTQSRLQGMADGMHKVADMADPVGEVLGGNTLANGLRLEKRSVPFGVIGVIYEARPNVTGDAAALCFKSGNACILRGGKEAIHSNTAIARALWHGLEKSGMNPDSVMLIEDTSRESATALMRANGWLDLLIPRGGAGLIRSVVENATVPVIETGVGNCHVYVEKTADVDMAAEIVFNAKTSRPSVCNAMETLLVDREIAERALPVIAEKLCEKQVEIRGCEETRRILPEAKTATEEDYAKEFLDYILAVKVVDDIDAAIAHIDRHSTHHSEAIVTRDYAAAEKFTALVDAAAVYVNASTRFTDGGEFGLGAEIGISTQKLHARGPLGLRQLVSYKYIVRGDGQIRV